MIKRYLRFWWTLTKATFKSDLINRPAAILFILGKIIRFLFFLLFFFLLFSKIKTIAGYNLSQVILFFLTFNLIDLVSQLFLRGVYYFRPLIVSGNFDFYLTRPINPLVASLTAHTDVLDLITLFPLIGYLIYFLISDQIVLTFSGILFYVFFIFCSLVIALSLHILVLVVGILTTEVDHIIWIYRDLTSMGRVPIDVYQQLVKNFLTFVVPVGVMMSFPAKALMGILSWQMGVYSFFITIIFFLISLRLWKFALTKYTSASS